MKISEEFYKFITTKDNIYKPISFFLGCVVLLSIFPFGETFEEIIKATGLTINSITLRFITYCILCLIWLGYWLWKVNFLPKNVENKIGIIIAISSQNDKQKLRLNDNLVHRLKSLINDFNLNHLMNIVVLDDHQSKRLSDAITYHKENVKSAKKWEKIRIKTNGHFFVYGIIKESLDNAENTYVFDCNALIVHPPVSDATQAEITREFLSSWYKQIKFEEKVELKGFEFTADSIFLSVQHIVGIAALISGDILTALKLHNALNNNPYFHKIKPLPKNLAYIKNKVKILLAEENLLMARICFQKGDLENAELYLNYSFQIQQNYNALIFRSVLEFLAKNDPKKALKTLYEAKELISDEFTWRYNEGFILMYLENFTKALKVYKQIAKQSYKGESNTITEVCLFNENFLIKNPEKIQSHFILGFIKYKKLTNKEVEALECFNNFIDKAADNPKYQLLLSEAKSYKAEIETNINFV